MKNKTFLNMIEFCDFCKITKSNASTKIADKTCSICFKSACSSGCKGVNVDHYWTTQHIPNNIKPPFICNECWDKARATNSDKIKGGMDLRASGSIWAIRLGEYAHKLQKESFEKDVDLIVEEIKRLIKLSPRK